MLFVKVIGFLPWCVLVGAAILLPPRHLEVVAFSPGYVSSPWYPSICVLGRLRSGPYHDPLGLSRVDGSISLGDDDRQSIYMALRMSMVTEDEMVIRQALSGGGFCSLMCTGAGKEVTSDEDED
ncbi:hypothetical protein VKT23_010838 [Stygiomarasmius scandens]|uniref:Uncharacterized protein n=1 Tax=Marasmiellus scandens TaxID=2682957 RepID=A0ABR1JFH3_9AGAR